jgi:hypothetical protein
MERLFFPEAASFAASGTHGVRITLNIGEAVHVVGIFATLG